MKYLRFTELDLAYNILYRTTQIDVNEQEVLIKQSLSSNFACGFLDIVSRTMSHARFIELFGLHVYIWSIMYDYIYYSILGNVDLSRA